VVRIGTWNLQDRWDARHLQLLNAMQCDLLLLTEVPERIVQLRSQEDRHSGAPRMRLMSTPLHELPAVGAPARRALVAAGYESLRQLAGVPRASLSELHGVGPKALRILEAALEEHGLSLS
jgi:3-deoxy-D-arabino-heptulosonate 7-phosphate (DAHP) synthase